MPRKNLMLFLAILFATALGMSRAFSKDKYYRETRTLMLIMNNVMQNYVKDVEADQLFEGAYHGMLRGLDPYTQYLKPEVTKSFSEDTEGQFGGLGIEIAVKDGVLTVISPIRGTPAYEEGMQAGDMILKIDGQSTERILLREAVKRLRGKPGTKVTLTVRRVGFAADKEIVITRAVIKPPSIEHEFIDKENGIALIRVPSFNARVMKDMVSVASDLKEENLRALILDLRQNPGGLLNVAVGMCDLFVKEGVVVSVKGRHKENDKEYRARPGDALEDVRMVVLIDDGSASASEIVAGCLRDHQRGILLGSRTYGKGSVQNIIPLGDGHALKLTTAKYYTPNDIPIEDHQGIEPDVPVPMTAQYRDALRIQEREDKLRGNYHIGRSLEEGVEEQEEAAPAPKENGDEPRPENGGDTLKKQRRGRVVDFQLKAALNILRWQLKPTAAR